MAKRLSNVISSQIDIFKNYGGVVPEIASRHHLENINQSCGRHWTNEGTTLDEIDLIGVTCGPGLIGALLVGVATAKGGGFREGYPFGQVHHLLGHQRQLHSRSRAPPFIALITSGGHTEIVDVQELYRL